MKKKINIRIPEDLKDEFYKVADLNAQNPSELVRRWIENYIRREKGQMARQFNLCYVKDSVDGKTVTAMINDKDYNRFTTFAPDVKFSHSTDEGNFYKFPKRKIVGGNVLDLDR